MSFPPCWSPRSASGLLSQSLICPALRSRWNADVWVKVQGRETRQTPQDSSEDRWQWPHEVPTGTHDRPPGRPVSPLLVPRYRVVPHTAHTLGPRLSGPTPPCARLSCFNIYLHPLLFPIFNLTLPLAHQLPTLGLGQQPHIFHKTANLLYHHQRQHTTVPQLIHPPSGLPSPLPPSSSPSTPPSPASEPARMSAAALQYDPGFNHFHMGGRTSFAWSGMWTSPFSAWIHKRRS